MRNAGDEALHLLARRTAAEHQQQRGQPGTAPPRATPGNSMTALLLDSAHVSHRDLRTPRPARPTVRLVDEAIRVELAWHAPDVTGLSCLADGAGLPS